MGLKRPETITYGRWKFLLWKAYFETGDSLLGHIKQIVGIFSLSTLDFSHKLSLDNFEKVAFYGLAYIVSCFYIGWEWYRRGMIQSQNEFGNSFNDFINEMRNSIKK